MLTSNVGGIDKTIRIVLGFILAAAGLFLVGPGPVKWVVLALAGISFGTALISFCPISKLIGLNTCKR